MELNSRQVPGLHTCVVVEGNAYRMIPVRGTIKHLILSLCLDSVILKVISNLNYSMILLKKWESNNGEGTLSGL